jgi:hypothetical protein
LIDRTKVFYRLEEGAAARAEGARIRRDDYDAFRAVPLEDIITRSAIGVDEFAKSSKIFQD